MLLIALSLDRLLFFFSCYHFSFFPLLRCMLKRGESRGSKLFFFFLFFVRVGASWRVGVCVHSWCDSFKGTWKREREREREDEQYDRSDG